MSGISDQFKLAVGWNNAGSLVSIVSITPTGDYRPFHAPDGWAEFDAGLERVRLDELGYLSGFAATAWKFAALSRWQYAYLRTTYTLGGVGYRGKVTVRTLDGSGLSFANFNAIIDIEKLPEEKRVSRNYQDITVKFLGLVAL